MVLGIVLCAGGLAVLAFAADKFVVAAEQLAKRLGIPSVIVGAVVVGFGTSAPEIVVSSLAAAGGDTELGVGNIIGSNVANVTMVVGVAGVAATIPVSKNFLKRELPASFAAVGLFALLLQGGLSRIDGVILLGVLVVVLSTVIFSNINSVDGGIDSDIVDRADSDIVDRADSDIVDRADSDIVDGVIDSDIQMSGPQSSHSAGVSPALSPASQSGPSAGLPPGSPTGVPLASPPAPQSALRQQPQLLWLIVGLAGTVAGAQLIVEGSQRLAEALDLGSGFVGLTVVAVGTSLPELITAAAASRRGLNELLLGNVLGSNIFNSLAVGGAVAVIGPSSLSGSNLAGVATLIMLAAMVLLLFFALVFRKIGRWHSILLLASWGASLPLVIS